MWPPSRPAHFVLRLALTAAVAEWAAPRVVSGQELLLPDSVTVALYHLDDASDTTVVDASPNGLHAIVRGATPILDGRFDGAYQFDRDDCIVIPNTDLTFTENATYEAWVYLTDEPAQEIVVIEKALPLHGGAGRGLSIGSDGRAHAYAFSLGGTQTAKSRTMIPLNQWVHVAAVFDDVNHRVRVVVNGVVEAQEPMSRGSASFNLTVTIGRRNLGASGFCGRIDEVRLSSVARPFPSTAVESITWGLLKTYWR